MSKVVAMRQASLPMYDFAPLHDTTDRWWQGIAQRIRGWESGVVPLSLTRGTSPATLWRDDALLFSQSCGYPLTHEFAAHLAVVATPCFDAPGCRGALYSSALVVARQSPADDVESLRGCTLAFNMLDSMSGYRVWQSMLAEPAERYFDAMVETGSHHASLRAIAERRADVAAVDVVSLALIGDLEPALLASLRVLDYSPGAPGLPYVTRADISPAKLDALRAAVVEAAQAPALADVRRRLRIATVEVLEPDAYAAIAALA